MSRRTCFRLGRDMAPARRRRPAALRSQYRSRYSSVAVEPQHRRRTRQRAARTAASHASAPATAAVDADLLLDRPQVHTHRPAAQRAHHQRHRQRDRSSVSLRQRGEPLRHMHIGGSSTPASLNVCSRPRRARRCAIQVVMPPPAPSSRSDSAVISAAGGCQLNTPAGWPSTTGVSGPHMPRRNRYSTPPRCCAGVVTGLPPAQKPMQHNAVQQRLQRIVGVQHRLDQARPGRSPRPSAAPVGSPSQFVL